MACGDAITLCESYASTFEPRAIAGDFLRLCVLFDMSGPNGGEGERLVSEHLLATINSHRIIKHTLYGQREVHCRLCIDHCRFVVYY